ncbi:MAG: sn-glycerol-1-phosphate dehydrogenase [Lachnospiraceae bacterium]|nr:sn-glycerol-1-phosphate dehydrogenase [Lachnospiraceae bacterium]
MAEIKTIIGNGVVNQLPEVVKNFGAKKVFVLADVNTDKAAGGLVCDILDKAEIVYSKYVMQNEKPTPDEHTVGSVMMHFDSKCDLIVAVGSGVINDVTKILANISGLPYVIVATAPSMDGYASATSSMERDGLKVSLPSKCADVIIGDVDIMKNAPDHLLSAGLGDMLAKYVSICEWRIANIITGEFYSEPIAQMVREALKRCVDNSAGLMKRDDEAVKAVFEGLIICGQAMALAGVSRPASGVEHYFSHVWDMRALEFGTKAELHGTQCAVGTLLASKLYEQIKKMTPDREKAMKYAADFDHDKWAADLKKFLGKGADAMIALEGKEKKYDIAKHAERFDVIEARWNDILKVIEEELPSSAELEACLVEIKAPTNVEALGVDPATLPETFRATKDIRDKYVLSRLAWDLGVLDELVVG